MLPTYFLSHGGPTLIEDYDHPAYSKLEEIGQEILALKPKAIIVFSAHWQGEGGTIEVNTSVSEKLIYDFYGFPRHLYKYQFPTKGSPELAGKIMMHLNDSGIKATAVHRGLDHGVWVSFVAAFKKLDIPLVQVSLYDNEDPHLHYKLGEALTALRDDCVIISTGMACHNLYDFRRTIGMDGALSYAVSFDQALREAVEVPVAERETKMVDLLQRSDARQAHPTMEHLLPIHVAAGAASKQLGEQIWTKPEGSLSWAMYRFGGV